MIKWNQFEKVHGKLFALKKTPVDLLVMVRSPFLKLFLFASSQKKPTLLSYSSNLLLRCHDIRVLDQISR